MKVTSSIAMAFFSLFFVLGSVSSLMHIQLELEAPTEFIFTFSSLKSSSSTSFPNASLVPPALHGQLEMPNDFTFTFSSLKSSSSSTFFPNAFVVRPALHVQLQASNNEFTASFSSLKSSSSACFPNALVVIYSGEYDVKMKESDESDIYKSETGTCPAPLAAYNTRLVNTRLDLTKSPKCTLNLLVDDKWSEASRELKDGRIVLKLGCDEVPADNNTQRKTGGHVFTWGEVFVFVFVATAIVVTWCSIAFFENMRRERGDYFDPYELELERQWLEENGPQ